MKWLILTLMSFLIGLAIERPRLNEHLRHKRTLWRYLVILIMALGIVEFQPRGHWWYLYIFVACSLPLLIIPLFYPLPHERILIDKELLLKGKWKIWLLSTPGKIQFFIRVKEQNKRNDEIGASLEYLNNLKSLPLLNHEKQKYIVPALNVLLKIGAFHKLREELEKLPLSVQKKSVLYRSYLGSIEYMNFDYNEEKRLFKEALELKEIDDQYRIVCYLNLASCDINTGNKDNQLLYLIKAKEVLDRHKWYDDTLYGALIQYYQSTGENDKAELLLQESRQRLSETDFEKFTSWADVALKFYSFNQDKERLIKLIDCIFKRIPDFDLPEEKRILYTLQLLRVCFDNDYRWKELSIELYKRSSFYLDYSQLVAYEFIDKAVLILNQCEQFMGIMLGGSARLFNEFIDFVERDRRRLNEKIHNIPDHCLYEKKTWLMFKVRASYLLGMRTRNYKETIERVIHSIDQIITLCNINENKREWLHFNVVIVDEIITYLKSIETIESGEKELSKISEDEEKNMTKEALRSTNYYWNRANEYIDNIAAFVSQKQYDVTVNFYILYLANFYMIKKDKERCSYFFHRFKHNDLSIDLYPLSTRSLHKSIELFCSE